jgi:ppGpp synthetase/RelA/SpoT-type nucleotidyltranferase
MDDDVLDDVRNYIDGEGDSLKGLLQTLRTTFEVYGQSPEGKGRIYRVYSRGEKQNGEEFKAIWKIAEKLSPGVTPSQVNDIVGLTVVCPFTSDQDTVERDIEHRIQRGEFRFIELHRHDPTKKNLEKPGRTAYEATHYTLTTPRYFHLRCEVQVKTVLHDAWSAKTHDLTYKPGGNHDQRLSIQMDTLSTILSALEKQTEIIRQLAEESWYFDKEKKQSARSQIIKGLTDSLKLVSDETHKAMLSELQTYVAKGLCLCFR